MRERLISVYLRLMKYAILMGVLGGIATFIGHPRHGLIKAGMGIVFGAMLLGHKLSDAMNELFKITSEITDEVFRE